MMKKKENLLVLGMFSLIIAIILGRFGDANLILDLLIFLFVGIAIFANARYIVLVSLEKNKK
ncbi:MAG: hypothetical protein ACFFD5_05950 [Candidatus Thorarchaeota archaeon]